MQRYLLIQFPVAAILEFKMAPTNLVESHVSHILLIKHDQYYNCAKFHMFITF